LKECILNVCFFSEISQLELEASRLHAEALNAQAKVKELRKTLKRAAPSDNC
jgi:hypothetical protein